MAIITRFGGSGGGTPIVDPYPHVWECTVVQSGTTGVVSGVVTLEAYDILHYTMPLGFSTYDLMIGGVTYHTSFRNEGEMYVQWTGSDFVVVSANAACALPHVWVNPTYTITGSVLEITSGVDDLHTNDVIEITLASGESASVIEYESNTYTIDAGISTGVNYVKFNGTSFENGLFNFNGDATSSDVASGKTFYSSDGTLRTGVASLGELISDIQVAGEYRFTSNSDVYTINNVSLDKALIFVKNNEGNSISNVSITQNGSNVDVQLSFTGTGRPSITYGLLKSDSQYHITTRVYNPNESETSNPLFYEHNRSQGKYIFRNYNGTQSFWFNIGVNAQYQLEVSGQHRVNSSAGTGNLETIVERV